MKDRCTCCPECGSFITFKAFDNYIDKGYRVCFNCEQEWYTDITYPNHINLNSQYRLEHITVITPRGYSFNTSTNQLV